jgi:hypothetical protein
LRPQQHFPELLLQVEEVSKGPADHERRRTANHLARG